MNLGERGRGFIRKTLLISALLSPLQASSVQAETVPFLPASVDQLSTSTQQEPVKTELPYTEDSTKWQVAASYTSDFTRSEPYREHNIIAGSNGLNNYFWDFAEIDGKLVKYGKNVIKPGESFSINSVLGDEANDYVIGYAIGDDLKPIPVNGGGICQVSTTIFDASLYGGLFIKERSAHFYVYSWALGDPNDPKEMGKDATVYMSGSDSIPSLDLVVRNTYDYPIRFFLQKVNGQHLRAEIYAPPEANPHQVEIVGPTMVYPFKDALVKDIGRYLGPANTTVIQIVWKDGKKLSEKSFDSSYQAFPQ